MESFTVNQLGRSTSRIAFSAERSPVAITRRKKRIAVVVSPVLWEQAEAALYRLTGYLPEVIPGSTEPVYCPECPHLLDDHGPDGCADGDCHCELGERP